MTAPDLPALPPLLAWLRDDFMRGGSSEGCARAASMLERQDAELARLRAALAAQQPAAVPSAHDIRAIVQQAYMALEELQGPGFLIGGVMHYRIGLILPKLNEAIDMLAAAPAVQPSRDREADRARFTDPVFNRWLDEGISDAGHTVWDAVGDTQAAWQGWENRPHYVGEQPAEAVAPVPSAAVLLAEQVLHMDMVTERGIRARDLARQVLDTAHDVHEGECAALLRELASYLSAGGYNAPAVNPQTYREKIIWGIEQVRAAAPSAQPVAQFSGATVLPDGSAFSTASFPLPKDHWLYAPRGEWDNERDEYAECPQPILTNAQRDAVRTATRYAIRGATMCGQDQDFDPDALVLNVCYALCGPANGAVLPADAAAPSAPQTTKGDEA